jgi:hypothetical protein
VLSFRSSARRAAGYGIPAAVAILVLSATAAASLRLYHDAPPLAHTGGFGEGDCTACHFDNEPDDGVGEVSVRGFPERYEPGEKYRIVVEVRRPGIVKGGFQAAIRQVEGGAAGHAAGELRSLGERTSVSESDTVAYVQHTARGNDVGDGVARWEFEWTAPVRASGRLLLNAAANAANGDNSEFGDYIYRAELVSRAMR